MQSFFKLLFSLILIYIFGMPSAHTQGHDQYLKEGKLEFTKENNTANYTYAVEVLTKALEIKPSSSEAWYFLGYAYSRLNYQTAHDYIGVKSSLSILASEAFEKVNLIESNYSGEIVSLDPYSKITAEWGVLALSFSHKSQLDSVVWALKEGKKRGGFSEFLLAYNRNVLRNCSQQSILFTTGDNFYFTLFYLQIIEGMRPDVSLVNIDLLNTKWYPFYLQNHQGVFFGMVDSTLENVVYDTWKDSMFVLFNESSQKAFAWRITPTYLDAYILRSDILMLALLKMNEMKKEVYFTNGIPNQQSLNIRSNLLSKLVVNKMNVNYEQALSNEEFVSGISEFLNYLAKININSRGELFLVDDMRLVIISRIKDALILNDLELVKTLLDFLNNQMSESKYPVFDMTIKGFIDALNIQFKG